MSDPKSRVRRPRRLKQATLSWVPMHRRSSTARGTVTRAALSARSPAHTSSACERLAHPSARARQRLVAPQPAAGLAAAAASTAAASAAGSPPAVRPARCRRGAGRRVAWEAKDVFNPAAIVRAGRVRTARRRKEGRPNRPWRHFQPESALKAQLGPAPRTSRAPGAAVAAGRPGSMHREIRLRRAERARTRPAVEPRGPDFFAPDFGARARFFKPAPGFSRPVA